MTEAILPFPKRLQSCVAAAGGHLNTQLIQRA